VHSNLRSQGHNTISLLCGNTAYSVKLSGEDLARYSSEIESVDMRKCLYCHYLTKKFMSIFSELASDHGGKIAGIDMAEL